jgi:hypothetical protein
VEAVKALGAGTFTKHPFFARLYYCTADLRSGLLAAAIIDAVCERRGHEAGYEKYERNDYQQKQH